LRPDERARPASSSPEPRICLRVTDAEGSNDALPGPFEPAPDVARGASAPAGGALPSVDGASPPGGAGLTSRGVSSGSPTVPGRRPVRGVTVSPNPGQEGYWHAAGSPEDQRSPPIGLLSSDSTATTETSGDREPERSTGNSHTQDVGVSVRSSECMGSTFR
jgi:hypothetical protein